MPDLKNHNLDEFFQRGAERYDFGYNPAAWAKMEAMLRRKERRRMAWWWLGIGLGIAGILLLAWFFFGNPEPEPAASRPPLAAEAVTGARTGESPTDLAPAEVKTKKSTPGPGVKATEKAREKKQQAIARAGEKQPAPASAGPAPHQPEAGPENSRGPLAPHPVSENGAAPESPHAAEAPLAALPPVLPKQLHPLPGKTEQPGSWLKPPPPPPPAPVGRLSFGPACSGALNSVGWGDFSSAAWKAGGALEYRYASKYTLSIGLLYQKMSYRAGRGEYIPPKGFWTRKIAPVETEGQCTLLEMPVLLQYYPRSAKRSGPFAGAGFTSFFLLNEGYHYIYEQTDPDLVRWWRTDESSRHWFATGRLSLGYQKVLSPRMALQAAPYLQAPLSGIGHGQVKLYSVGIGLRLMMGKY